MQKRSGLEYYEDQYSCFNKEDYLLIRLVGSFLFGPGFKRVKALGVNIMTLLNGIPLFRLFSRKGFFRFGSSSLLYILTAALFLFFLPLTRSFAEPQERTLRIGAFNYYPGIFKDRDDAIKGFYVDLFRIIAEKEGWNIEYVYGSWAEGLERLKNGEIDVVTSAAKTEERLRFMDYCHNPILTVWGELYVHESSGTDSILDMKSKKIAVMKNDFNGMNFKKLAESFSLRCEYVEVDNFDEVLKKVESKSVDGGVVNSIFGAGKSGEYAVKATGVVFNPFDIYLAVGKGRNADILAALDDYLEKWKDDTKSPYYSKIKEWLRKETGIHQVVPSWVWQAFAMAAGIVAVFILFNLVLRKRVRTKTSELMAYADRLRESEFRFRSLHESMVDPFAQTDISGLLIDFNRPFIDMLGYSPDELMSLKYEDLTPKKWHEMERAIVENEIMVKGYSGVYQKEYVKKDGTVFPVELRTFLIRDQKDNPSGMWAIIRDISERKQAEEEKKRNEERLHSLLSIMQHRSETSREFLDFALHEALGLTYSKIGYIYHYDEDKKEFSLNSWSRDVMDECTIVSPKTCYALEKTGFWGEAVRQRKPIIINDFSVNNPLKKGYPEGHVRLTRFMTLPVFKNDRIIAVIGVGNKEFDYNDSDLLQLSILMEAVFKALERNQALDALVKSEARMAEFMRHVPSLILIKDHDLKPVYANEKFKAYFPFADWQGKTPHELFAPDIAEFMIEKDNEALEKGYVAFEEAWADMHGESHVFFTSKFRIDLPDSKPMLGVIISDITERKTAELALSEMTEVFRLFMENNPIYVFIKDENIRAVYLSRNFEQMIGRPLDEIIGKTMDELFPSDLAKSMIEDDKKILKEGKLLEVVEELDGRTYTTIKFPIMINGVPKYLAGYTMDITERKLAEQEKEKLYTQLLQSQKMESIGRLAGGVAHDFNNMLQAIIGFSDMALMKLDESDHIHSYIEEIQKAALKSADLTRQLLAFARKQTVVPKILDLNEVVASMVKMLGRMIGEEIQLVLKPGGGIGKIYMDPTQVDQVVANLAVNARDAINGTGTITISTENCSLDPVYCMHHAGMIPGDYVLLKVSDDGCGMSEDVIGKIFEPFFTTKDVGEGSGLGLATVYGIVKQNSGFIDVESRPGYGTVFSVYIPMCAETSEEKNKSLRPREAAGGSETILFVEDEPVLLNLGKAVLRHHGYTVITSASPSEALHIAESYPNEIHLLITDVVMPEMNGRELSEIFLKIKPGAKCIFMSGYATDLITDRGALTEGAHFIQKPFSTSDLATKVREVLDS